MTDEDWKYIEDTLSHIGSVAQLKIDDYSVTLMVEPYQKLQNCITVYVNGKIKGDWIFNDCEIRRRFYRCKKRSLLTRKQKEMLKREKKSFREEITKMAEYQAFSPYWLSFRSLKQHLIQNNASIKICAEES